MSEFIDNLEAGEGKGLEPVTQEQLKELLDIVNVLTDDIEPSHEHGEGPFRIFEYELTEGYKLTIYAQDTEVGRVASFFYDWQYKDFKASRSVTIAKDELGNLEASQSWSYDDHKDRQLLLDIYHRVRHLENDLQAQMSGQLNSAEAEADVELLNDLAEVAKNGLKEGDICRFVDESSGQELLLLIDRDSHMTGLKYFSFGIPLTPLAEGETGEAADAKRTDWIDVEITAQDGQRYMVHGDGYDTRVYRDQVEKIGKAEESMDAINRRIEARVHKLHSGEGVNKQLFKPNSFGELHNPAYSHYIGDRADLLRQIADARWDSETVNTHEDIAIAATGLIQEVLPLFDAASEAADYAYLGMLDAWDKFLSSDDFMDFAQMLLWLNEHLIESDRLVQDINVKEKIVNACRDFYMDILYTARKANHG